MDTIDKLFGTYNQVKFWIISAAISGVAMLALPNIISEISVSNTPGSSLWHALLIVIAVFGIFLLPFAAWQHVSRKNFFAWLEANWSGLEVGVLHPDGYTITLDSPLVRYQAVFSAILASVSFASRPYVIHHRSAGVAQASFTMLSAIFGWWFLGLEGVVQTVKAVAGNLRSSQTFTLRQLSDDQGDS